MKDENGMAPVLRKAENAFSLMCHVRSSNQGFLPFSAFILPPSSLL
jgi:hypothetical protein